MNQECCERLPADSLSAGQVATYLLENPDFFASQAWLLEHLKIPHDCGTAVSLIEHQVALLRQTNQTLCDQIDTLVRIARANDALLRNMHELTLALLQAHKLADMVTAVEECLRERFQLERVALRLFHPAKETARSDLFLASRHFAMLQDIFDAREPYIGAPNAQQLACLFQNETSIRSCALVPLFQPRMKGILSIGSRDQRRFWPGLGKVYLARLGEIIGARTEALLASEN